jgi:hypothetical protein
LPRHSLNRCEAYSRTPPTPEKIRIYFATLLDQNLITPDATYITKRFGSLQKARVLAKLPDQTRSQTTISLRNGRRRASSSGAFPDSAAEHGICRKTYWRG